MMTKDRVWNFGLCYLLCGQFTQVVMIIKTTAQQMKIIQVSEITLENNDAAPSHYWNRVDLSLVWSCVIHLKTISHWNITNTNHEYVFESHTFKTVTTSLGQWVKDYRWRHDNFTRQCHSILNTLRPGQKVSFLEKQTNKFSIYLYSILKMCIYSQKLHIGVYQG